MNVIFIIGIGVLYLTWYYSGLWGHLGGCVVIEHWHGCRIWRQNHIRSRDDLSFRIRTSNYTSERWSRHDFLSKSLLIRTQYRQLRSVKVSYHIQVLIRPQTSSRPLTVPTASWYPLYIAHRDAHAIWPPSYPCVLIGCEMSESSMRGLFRPRRDHQSEVFLILMMLL